ncbi:MAG: hypothetical protein EXS16_01575 [Gemmataceae bacterium]|nr:hypothetical protein [Gemmataceae bacterium]
MKVTFACPACDQPDAVLVDATHDWQCSACDHRQHFAAADSALPDCVVCSNHEFYKRKDFPHTLGMVILVGALLLSTITYHSYEKWWSWSFLIGSAIIDGGLYLLVGDVVVCYRCNAHYRGLTASDAHQPFEITIGERYRQERIRQERLK